MKFTEIDAATLKTWLDAGQAVLVDVREEDEFRAAAIPGAVLLPLSRFHPGALPECGDRKLVFHCAMGGRSAQAAMFLLQNGLTDEAIHLQGGIGAWAQAGYPVAPGKL